jgi:carbon-monoxide dehydrogenase small subunit
VKVALTLNGAPAELECRSDEMLLDVLRREAGLTSVRETCRIGVCGACTVLVDGDPMRSCLMFAVSAQDMEITTVEGLGTQDDMGPVQQAFVECHGLQCGFCTPGFVTTITAFIEENPDPTSEEAREAISGNLCRCTGYQNIVRAVQTASGQEVIADSLEGSAS